MLFARPGPLSTKTADRLPLSLPQRAPQPGVSAGGGGLKKWDVSGLPAGRALVYSCLQPADAGFIWADAGRPWGGGRRFLPPLHEVFFGRNGQIFLLGQDETIEQAVVGGSKGRPPLV